MNPFYNPFEPLMQNPDVTKDYSEDEQLRLAASHVIGYLIALTVGLAICALLSACSTQRIVEQYHHHHYEADTAAVRAAVDSRLQSWHEESEAWLRQAFSEQSSSWSSHEDQRETITELITVSSDSLGREIRTEQRTANRSIINGQRSMVNSITREYEQRLRVAVDSVGSIYQQRYDSLAARVVQLDSLSKSVQSGSPASKPWYQRLFEQWHYFINGFLIAVVLWLTRRYWWSLLKKQHI